MSKRSQLFLQTKQAVFAYFSSMICLLGFFLWTMLVHNNEKIDWDYLGYATAHIIVISAVPAIIIYFTKRSNWYFSIISGAIIGFLMAVLLVKIKIGF
jgi:mannose/fructose/N-acetylgalactosamine-specific phosphotransferase system component IIC